MFLALCVSTAYGDSTCKEPLDTSELISTKSELLAPKRFEEIRRNMTLMEILELLGPAFREVGSGLYIFEWQSTDGRIFIVSGGNLCAPPMRFGFSHGSKSAVHP